MDVMGVEPTFGLASQNQSIARIGGLSGNRTLYLSVRHARNWWS